MTTTIATGWKVTLRDARIFAFTDHDVDATVDGVLYKSAIGYVPSAIEQTTDLQANNQTLTGLIDSVDITDGDLLSGAWDGARVEIIEFDWANPAAGALRVLLVGFLGALQLSGRAYSAELQSLESELAKPIGRTVQLRCDADLGDTRCGVTLTSDSATVTAVTDRMTFTAAALVAADGYYQHGAVTWTSGANNGFVMDVRRYLQSGGAVELAEPMPGDIQIGDTFTISRGCDKTLETCRDTFANAINFRGFPHLPGVTDLIAGTTQ